MDQSQIENLACTWIANIQKLIKNKETPGSNEDIPNHVLDDMVYDDPENAWLIINSARLMTQDERMLANIAAGPLENLIRKHGEKFIDRFEALAKMDADFIYLLSGVWLSKSMPQDLAARIEEIKKLSSREL